MYCMEYFVAHHSLHFFMTDINPLLHQNTDGTTSLKLSILTNIRDRNMRQLSQREMKMIFEDVCDSDFSSLRDFMR